MESNAIITPKEKALEMFHKFYMECKIFQYGQTTAYLACEFMIDELNYIPYPSTGYKVDRLQFWEAVQHEIANITLDNFKLSTK